MCQGKKYPLATGICYLVVIGSTDALQANGFNENGKLFLK